MQKQHEGVLAAVQDLQQRTDDTGNAVERQRFAMERGVHGSVHMRATDDDLLHLRGYGAAADPLLRLSLGDRVADSIFA